MGFVAWAAVSQAITEGRCGRGVSTAYKGIDITCQSTAGASGENVALAISTRVDCDAGCPCACRQSPSRYADSVGELLYRTMEAMSSQDRHL